MLERIKLKLGLQNTTDKDELLMLLIEDCISEAQNYTHNDDVAGYENVICNMVIYSYNRLGSEGVNAETYSGVRFEYSADYPESILRQLRSHRKVITIHDK